MKVVKTDELAQIHGGTDEILVNETIAPFPIPVGGASQPVGQTVPPALPEKHFET